MMHEGSGDGAYGTAHEQLEIGLWEVRKIQQN